MMAEGALYSQLEVAMPTGNLLDELKATAYIWSASPPPGFFRYEYRYDTGSRACGWTCHACQLSSS